MSRFFLKQIALFPLAVPAPPYVEDVVNWLAEAFRGLTTSRRPGDKRNGFLVRDRRYSCNGLFPSRSDILFVREAAVLDSF